MRLYIFRFLSIYLLLFSPFAYAYIGPGVGLGAVGTAIALLAALVLLVVGFVWYPIKRLLRGRKTAKAQDEGDKN